MAVFVWFHLAELAAGGAEEAGMLYPNLLGKGKVLRIRTCALPTPVLTSLQTLQREAPCLLLRAWSRVTSLALEIFQRSPGDRLAGTRQKKFWLTC